MAEEKNHFKMKYIFDACVSCGVICQEAFANPEDWDSFKISVKSGKLRTAGWTMRPHDLNSLDQIVKPLLGA